MTFIFPPTWQKLSLFDRADFFMSCFANMTKEQADAIQDVLKWDDETKVAFLMAKRTFEAEDDE